MQTGTEVLAETVEECWSVGLEETKTLVESLRAKYQNQSDIHVRAIYHIQANQDHIIVFRFNNTQGL